MTMRTTLRIALVALLAGASVAITAPASADSTIAVDARMYAAEMGVPLAVAGARLANQQAIGEYAARLERRFPNQVAGIWLEHRPEYRVVIRLTRGSADLIRRADPLALPTAVGVAPIQVRDDAAQSGQALQAELDRLRPRIARELPGVSSEIDVRTGEIVLLAEQVSAPTAGAVAGMRTASPAPLRFDTYNGPAGDHNIHGGKRLSTCTSGFTVVHQTTGARGFITAAHCSNSQTYFQTATITYPAVYQSGIRDSRHDVQWHTVPTGGNVYPRFYADSDSTPRDLLGSRGWDQQVVGDFSCHRGKTTRYSCGTLVSKTFAPAYDGACGGVTCANVWMRVEGPSLACYAGDSGGPWFVGNIALGVHSSGSTSGTENGDCAWAAYMAINYAAGLGVGTLRAN